MSTRKTVSDERVDTLIAAMEALLQAVVVQNEILRDRTFGTNREVHHAITAHLNDAIDRLETLRD